MRVVKTLVRRESGIALLTTMLLLLLMSSLLVGFILLIISGQQISGLNSEYSRGFYAAEAGMEKMTADLGTLFDNTYAPSAAELAVIKAAPPALTGIQYQQYDGSSGYLLTYPTDNNGNPLASNTQIKSGPFQGMTALATPYTLTVTARTPSGAEVKLQRTTQTVGIPIFQFGIFSDPDLGFHAGPNFNFGGRIHTNGNLFLAEGGGSTLTLSDRVTAFKDVIRTNLMNGLTLAAGPWTGTVNITTSPGTTKYRVLAPNEGSLTGTKGSPQNSNWPNISLGTTNYAGNLRNGNTGAKQLNLAIVTFGTGLTQPVDVLRRPLPGEGGSVTGERYFAQASLKILLSDNPQDIMNLPCIDTTTQPFHFDDLAGNPNNPGDPGYPAAQNWTSANAVTLKAKMLAAGTPVLPLAASGAASGAYVASGTAANGDGYWFPAGRPLIQGYIKIEAQTTYGSPCGAWVDVTQEILSLGYAGKNLNPVVQSTDGSTVTPQWTWNGPASGAYKWLPGLPAVAIGPSACGDPHPNAVIRLERIRDNASSAPYSQKPSPVGSWNPPKSSPAQMCGVDTSTNPPTVLATAPTDFWPSALFDTRQGTLRDASPAGSLGTINYSKMPTLGGLMNYIELDANNLGRWFTGAIGATGPNTRDPNIAPNNFVVYISDRRGNYAASQTWAGTWPPLSPSGHETGEYGFSDFINPNNAATGCPNSKLDTGEDVAGTAQLYTYGQDPTHAMSAYGATNYGQMGPFAAGLNGSSTNNALTPSPSCAVTSPSNIWPGTFVVHANEGRENPNFFFRRAVKIVNGKLLNLGLCPGNVSCGLTIAMENPLYVQGDYNANSAGGGFNDPSVATSVLADAFTMLSKNWNDVNSFSFPYSTGGRPGVTTFYRTAVLAGKGIGFPWIAGTTNDTGSDGGVHNFLRYIETWGGAALNYRGSIASLFFNRQATGIFTCCATVYTPPTRGYNFDTNFLTPALLPPRTPMFRDVNTTGFTQLLLPQQ